jgi:hypothetical protein
MQPTKMKMTLERIAFFASLPYGVEVETLLHLLHHIPVIHHHLMMRKQHC